MSVVCPAVTAYSVEEYHEQMTVAASFADYIHIDLGDGRFTKKTVSPRDVWWPETISADIHLMYSHPVEVLPKLIALQPRMVIIHAESEANAEVLSHLKQHGIAAGIALLQPTTVESARELIKQADHTMIFSGALGRFGGHADLALLRKVPEIRAINPRCEIGWDGGINTKNIAQLARGGVDVLYVGGAIQNAVHPQNAYRDLVRRLGN